MVIFDIVVWIQNQSIYRNLFQIKINIYNKIVRMKGHYAGQFKIEI